IEDSRVVAEATKRMLERQHLNVVHVITAEEAFGLLTVESLGRSKHKTDLVLTDVTLKGELSGRDVVQRIRVDFGYGKRRLPVLVMTGDANRHNQSELLKAGANDLVQKPIEERLLVTKVLVQLRLARLDGAAEPGRCSGRHEPGRGKHPPGALLACVYRRLAAAPGDARAVRIPAPAQGRRSPGLSAGAADLRGLRRHALRVRQGGGPGPGPVPRP